MATALWLLAVQGVIGAFDTLYFHEWRARLPARYQTVAAELKIHAVRDFLYAVIFGTLPWLTWEGRWALVLTAILIAEAGQQGHEVAQLMRFLGTAPAPAAVAERLGIEVGSPVHVRRRTTLIDGRPNQLADSYYGLELAEAVPAIKDEDTGPGGGFARIEEAGYRLARIREEIAKGRQCFVVCPLVEESELLQVRSATGEYERLSAEVFPDLRLALLHGRMKAADKDEVMEAFKAHRFDILVSTSVVEVGVGGRLSPTNVLDPEVAVLTNISLDHTALLGPPEADIAREKAQIIKPGASATTAAPQSDALSIIKERAAATKSGTSATQLPLSRHDFTATSPRYVQYPASKKLTPNKVGTKNAAETNTPPT